MEEPKQEPLLSRRRVIQGGVAVAGLIATSGVRASRPKPAMTVYRDPGCGCCGNWAELARRAGYPMRVIDSPDMPALKRRLGVPQQLEACHTATVASFVVEGHVPLDAVAWMLRRRPRGVRGLGVAGMPLGSPGMETPDGAREPFQVFAFNVAGRVAPLR